MAVTITKKLALKKFLPRAKRQFNKIIRRTITDEIVAEIISGKSPVKGHRFKKYSNAYAKIKGRSAPVDMLVTGKMLDSLVVTSRKSGILSIFFKNKIAKFHNDDGVGKGKVIRRLLPNKKGEEFKPKLMASIRKAIAKILKREVSKQNK